MGAGDLIQLIQFDTHQPEYEDSVTDPKYWCVVRIAGPAKGWYYPCDSGWDYGYREGFCFGWR